VRGLPVSVMEVRLNAERMALPEYPGALFRGRFGKYLRELACRTGMLVCDGCAYLKQCAHGVVFETPVELEWRKPVLEAADRVETVGREWREYRWSMRSGRQGRRGMVPMAEYGPRMDASGERAPGFFAVPCWIQSGTSAVGKGQRLRRASTKLASLH